MKTTGKRVCPCHPENMESVSAIDSVADMLINDVRKKVRADLESPAEMRRVGTGWLSGVAGLVAGLAGLFLVLCLRYPGVLTVPQIRDVYHATWFRVVLHF